MSVTTTTAAITASRGKTVFLSAKRGEEVVYLLDWYSYIKQVISQNHRKAHFYFGEPKEELKCRSLQRIPGVLLRVAIWISSCITDS